MQNTDMFQQEVIVALRCRSPVLYNRATNSKSREEEEELSGLRVQALSRMLRAMIDQVAELCVRGGGVGGHRRALRYAGPIDAWKFGHS